MNTSIYIAKRYLFAKKKTNAINIISGISMVGVFIGSATLFVILSAFNGLEDVILKLYSNFTPELKIEARMGKTFNPETPYFNSLRKDERIFSYTQALEEKGMVKYRDKTFIANIKGMSDDFLKNTNLDSAIQDGGFVLKAGNKPFAVIGTAVQNSLSVNVHDELTPMIIYSPRRTAGNSVNPMDAFRQAFIYPSGVFAIQQEFDDIVVVSLDFARDLLDEPNQVSSLELTFKQGADIDQIQEEIQEKLGDAFVVKNRRQQNVELYKTLNFERWSIFMILTFVLIVAIFNIIGTLTMLVMDKKQDIAILTSIGADKSLIKRIFFFEGMMIAMIGCVLGLVVGLIFCLLQQHYGFIKMSENVAVIDGYPIKILARDFILVLATVSVISVIASAISSRLSVKGLDDIKHDL
nr:FtsX-like permease family protein [uncultured Mucilaginibacter sp.]